MDWATININVNAGSAIDSSSAAEVRRKPRRFPVAVMEYQRHREAAHADRQRHRVAGGGAEVTQFVEAGVGDAAGDPDGVHAQQSPRGDAHRRPARIIGGQPVGDRSGPFPAVARGPDIAGLRPCPGAHVPAESGAQVIGGLEMLGDQRRVLIQRIRVALFDRGCQTPMQFGAVGLQLCFVGHGPDQRVVEGVLGVRGEPHLVDEFGSDQLADLSLTIEQRQLLCTKPQPDHRGGIQSLLGGEVEPVDTGGDGGLQGRRHGGIGMIDLADIITTGSGQHTPLGQIAHHLLDEKRVTGGPLGDRGGQPADRGVRPQQLG